MNDTKRFLIWLGVVLWCLCSLPFAHGQQCSDDQLAANTIVVKKRGGAVSAAAGCSSPSGHLFDEGFEAAGYDLGAGTPGWSESVTDTVDEDHAMSGVDPGNVCSFALRVNSIESNNYARYNNNSAIDYTAVNHTSVFSLYINSESVGGSCLIHEVGNGTTPGYDNYIKLTESAGEYLIAACGSNCTGNVTLATTTWYIVAMHLNTTAASSYISIGGDVACAGGAADTATCKKFTRNNANYQYYFYGGFESLGAGENIDLEFGYAYAYNP